MSWTPPEVSSTSVSTGRRRLVTNVSPTRGFTRPMCSRLCSIDIHSAAAVDERPGVDDLLAVGVDDPHPLPRATRTATAVRAGISCKLMPHAGFVRAQSSLVAFLKALAFDAERRRVCISISARARTAVAGVAQVGALAAILTVALVVGGKAGETPG